MNIDQSYQFQFQQQIDEDKENCLELNNLTLTMRDNKSNKLNRQAFVMSLKSHPNRVKRPFGVSNQDSNNNQLFNSNQQESPYSMFTPLSLLGEYQSATINPFLHHHEQKSQEKDQKEEEVQPSSSSSQNESSFCKQKEQKQQEKFRVEDAVNIDEKESKVKEKFQTKKVDQNIQQKFPPSIVKSNKSAIKSLSVNQSQSPQKQNTKSQILKEVSQQREYLVLSQINSPNINKTNQSPVVQKQLQKSNLPKDNRQFQSTFKNQQRTQNFTIVNISESLQNLIVLTKHTKNSSIKITLGDVLSYVSKELNILTPIDINKKPSNFIHKGFQHPKPNMPRQSVSSLPRKSISLFSRMMKPQDQLHPPRNCQNIQIQLQEQQLYLLVQKYSALFTFVSYIGLNSQESLTNLLRYKLKNTHKKSVKQANGLDVIHSCEYLAGDEQQIDEQDEEWSSKYITSRRDQTSRELRRSKLFLHGKNNQQSITQNLDSEFKLSTDEISFIQSLLTIFAFLIRELLYQYALMTGIALEENQQLQVSKEQTNLFIRLISLSNQVTSKLQKAHQLIPSNKRKQFHHLLYKVWLHSYPNQQQNDSLSSYSIFDSVFELLSTHQESVMFLLFVINQLESSLHNSQSLYKNKQSLTAQQNPPTQDIKTIRNPANTIYSQRFHNKKTINKQEQLMSSKRQATQKECQKVRENMNTCSARDSTQSSKDLLSKLNKRKSTNLLNNPFSQNHQNSSSHLLKPNHIPYNLKKLTSTAHISLQLKHSRDPQLHKQHLKMLQLQNSLKQRNQQLEQKQHLIKRLLLINELEEIQYEIQTRNQQVILESKLQTVRSTYREKIQDQKVHISELQSQVQSHKRNIQSIHTERHLQAKLFEENHHLHMIKKLALSSTARLKILRQQQK